MPTPAELEITLDFDAAERSAGRVRDMLHELRRRYDLSAFEYTKRIRIAPLEIPHSHPVITLSTWVRDELGLLSAYLHEQMHWYLTWYAHSHPPRWRELYEQLRQRYPDVPAGTPEGAPDDFSVYLHLVVNWLEVEVTAQFADRHRVIEHVRALPFYRWMYRRVIEDRESLAGLYRQQGLIPVRSAAAMSPDDLRLAALATEAPT
jgi:hypothetical protein